MENMSCLLEILNAAKDASEGFDKASLLQIHEFTRQQMEAAAGCPYQMVHSSNPSGGNGGAASSVPLDKLKPISFTELEVGNIHYGRVVYGKLCADALRMTGIATLLEDENGFVVRLAIYNATTSQADIKTLYPRGANVAVKEPYFKRAADCSILIRVDNPANVVKLTTEKGKQRENLVHVDVEDMRKKGNTCFREQRWDAAADHYTKCIGAALLQLKESSSNGNNNLITGLLHAYSNRAETWLKMKECERALEDCEEAIRINPGHFKALYRKGRALLGLRQYAAACEYLEKADKDSPGQREIQQALSQAKTLYRQSRNGKYVITDYLLGRQSSPPEVADFVGPVEIKMTQDGRGRGLYATEELRTGQLFLVSNAVAIAHEDGRSAFSTVWNSDYRGKLNTESQELLVAEVASAANKSQTLLLQLYSLDDSSEPENLHVPAIDLYKPNGQMFRGQEGKEKLQVDVNRIRDIITQNCFGVAKEIFASNMIIYEARFPQRGQNINGLWLLPSFINHSCLPNSSRVEVGSAMFIHASKLPIERGEEITMSYFDTLVPFPQRQAMCEGWGFKCKCKRCILEHSLKAALEPITSPSEELHEKATVQSIAARSLQQPSLDAHNRPACTEFLNLAACAEFSRLYVKAEEIIGSCLELKTEEEKDWIRASFVSAYFAGMQSNEFILAALEDRVISGEETMNAIQNTVPGDIRTLIMVAQQLVLQQSESSKRLLGDECQSFIARRASDRARDAYIRVCGTHSEDVLKALVFQHSRCPFFE